MFSFKLNHNRKMYMCTSTEHVLTNNIGYLESSSYRDGTLHFYEGMFFVTLNILVCAQGGSCIFYILIWVFTQFNHAVCGLTLSYDALMQLHLASFLKWCESEQHLLTIPSVVCEQLVSAQSTVEAGDQI